MLAGINDAVVNRMVGSWGHEARLAVRRRGTRARVGLRLSVSFTAVYLSGGSVTYKVYIGEGVQSAAKGAKGDKTSVSGVRN